MLLNHLGQILARDCDTVDACDDSSFQQLIDDIADEMVFF